jgi:hypothetical protein
MEGSIPFPKIVVNERPLRDVGGPALVALVENNDPPVLFARSGEMIRVGRDEENEPVMQRATEGIVRYHLTHAANFIHERVRKDGITETHVDPPRNVVEYVRSVPTLPFPPLIAIPRTPFFRPDGSLVTTPGYDPSTSLFYAPNDKHFTVDVPEDPTADDVHNAVTTVDEAVADFPYADEGSAANTLALLLTPMLRNVITEPTPMCVITKPTPGSGGSLLAEVVSLITTGRAAGMLSAPKDDDEVRKAITAALLTTNHVITLDNIEGVLRSPSLSRALTSEIWEDRRLGQTEIIRVPQRATWLASGNNLELAGDLPRRCYSVRLDPKTEHPWERGGFKHPELKLWVRANRANLVGALLTIGRAWFVRGQPVPADAPTIGSFEHWCKTISGVLHVAGMRGFLSTAKDVYQQGDDEAGQWYAFLEAWRKRYRANPKTTKQVVADLYDPDGDRLREVLPDMFGTIDPDRPDKALARRLGNTFKSQLGR